MKTSESQASLVPALFAAKQELPRIAKNKSGQAGNRQFKYAPIDVIMDAADPILWKHGLFITQNPDGHELITRLEHAASGEWRESRMPINAEHANMQSYGIEVTYRRRYAYPMILGIVTEEDVDIKQKNQRAGKDHTEDDRPRTGVAQDVLATTNKGKAIKPARKELIDKLSQTVREDFDAYGPQAAFERIDEQKLDDIEKIYLSTLLPSNVRNPITAYSREFHNRKVPV